MRGQEIKYQAYRLRSNAWLGHTPEIQMKSGEVVMLKPWDRIIGEPIGGSDSVKLLAINGELCEINEYCPWRELEVLGTNFDELYTTFKLKNSNGKGTYDLYWYIGDKIIVVDADSTTPFMLQRGDLVEAEKAEKINEYYFASKVHSVNNKPLYGNLEISSQFLKPFDPQKPYLKM